MEITGTIRLIYDKETFNSGFEKRDLVIDTEDQYSQPLLVQFLKEKISLLDNYKEGDKVKIGINLRGREHTPPGGETKFYNSIVGWKIEHS